MGKSSSRSTLPIKNLKRRKSVTSKSKVSMDFDAPLDDQGIAQHFEGVESLFVPYKGSKPAAMNINGHRIIILSQDAASLEDNLSLVGADRVRCIDGSSGASHTQYVIGKLAAKVKAGVVMAPHEIALADLLSSLRLQLPWIQ
jgi:hypothetical protein